MLKLLSDGWMYIHIPKTSGANFKQIVVKYYDGEYSIFSKSFNDINAPIVSVFWEKYEQEIQETIDEFKYFGIVKQKLLFQIQHAPLWVWQKSEMYNNEKVLTIVRNPYTKFISHYYASLYYLNQYFDFQTPSPEEFIKHEKINFFLKMDPCNYRTKQVDYLKDVNGDIKCDKIYKMEEDLKTLEKDFRLKNINRFKYNKAEYDRDYAKLFYSDELIEFVQTTYQDDFEYFGYDKEPFW